MGLTISSISKFPDDWERDYYLYILDCYNWGEPISITLRKSFDKIATFASKNNAVIIQGIPDSEYHNELMSWESINGVDAVDILPALMITTIHPKCLMESRHRPFNPEKISRDKLIFIKIGEVCKTSQDVLKIIEKILQDIKERKELKDFRIQKELKQGIGKVLKDAIILEPNIGGIGININKLINFLFGKK